MSFWAAAMVAALVGAIVGYSQTFVFAKIPEKWLQDYGVKETARRGGKASFSYLSGNRGLSP